MDQLSELLKMFGISVNDDDEEAQVTAAKSVSNGYPPNDGRGNLVGIYAAISSAGVDAPSIRQWIFYLNISLKEYPYGDAIFCLSNRLIVKRIKPFLSPFFETVGEKGLKGTKGLRDKGTEE